MGDAARKQIVDGGFEDVLLRAAADLKPVGNLRGELDERVVEKRHAALDGRSHAHLVLLHEQLDEVSFLVGIERAREWRTGRVSVPMGHVALKAGASIERAIEISEE